MTYHEKVLAMADDRDEARRIARTLPRPNAVRQVDVGKWAVVKLLPTKWSPAAVHRIPA